MPRLNEKDIAPRVAISIGAKSAPATGIPEFAFENPPPHELTECKSWSLDFDIQQLGDPFSVEVDNSDGRHTGKINLFDEIGVYLMDRRVGEKWTQMYDGIVTNVTSRSTIDGGNVLTITGADRGWFLVNCHVKPWISLEVSTWETLINKVCDPSWGLSPSVGNDLNHHIKQGRAGAVRYLTQKVVPKLQPFQTDVGQSPADILLHYGKIAKVLVNLYGRTVQIFKPGYERSTDYLIEYFRSVDERRQQGNVLDAQLSQDSSGIYTEVRCYSSVVAPSVAVQTDKVHAGEYWGTAYHPTAIPDGVARLHAFSDGEQMGRSFCESRAEWKYQRGIFDSWTYTVTVYGVSQGGLYYAPDSMIEVDDRVNQLRGNYYLAAVHMSCNPQSGARTRLTIKKPKLLAG